MDDDDKDSEEDDDDDPKDPQWGDVPYQRNDKSFECKLCKISFRTRNLLFKHLKDVTKQNTKKRGTPVVVVEKLKGVIGECCVHRR